MDFELSPDKAPCGNKAALLAEVETALALVGLARVSSEPQTMRRLHRNTSRSYARLMDLLPAGVRTMSSQEEDALWARIDPVRQWLESTACLCFPG